MSKTIEEIKAAKKDLENKIASLFCEFEKDNEVIVSDVRVGKIEMRQNEVFSTTKYDVNVEVKYERNRTDNAPKKGGGQE